MKYLINYTSLLLAMILVLNFSCRKVDVGGEEPNDRFISIEELRGMYQGEPIVIRSDKQRNERLFVGGVVISNPDAKNNLEATVTIQNYANGELRGMNLFIEGNSNRYKNRDSIIVKLDGARLERVDGILRLSNLTINEVGRISENNEQLFHTKTNNFSDIFTNQDKYENTLVHFSDIDVLDDLRGRTFGDGDIQLSDGQKEITVKTRQDATFANNEVPISGSFSGIIFYLENQTPYLSLRTTSDFDGEFFLPENYAGFPEEWEDRIGPKKAGQETDGYEEYPSGRWFLNNTQGINSATIPYKNKEWTMMLGKVPASIAMDFDLMFGASKFSFYYGRATNNAGDADPITVYAEYSIDGGQNWILLGPPLLENEKKQYYQEYDLNIKGSVRFRIRKDGAMARLIVDDIFVKPNER